MTPRRRALAVLAAAVAALAPVAACGIPTDDSPRVLAADTSTTVAAPSSAPADSANATDIYLSSGEGSRVLVARRRGLDDEPNPERALEALLAGPTTRDLDEGLTTSIPTESDLLGWDLDDGTLTIDLNEAFYTREGEAAVSTFAQVVLTVTALRTAEIERVRFRREGDAIQAFTARAAGTKDVVTRADYRSLDPDPD
ncbi:MAG TPA: GerMN domain-containing protein [Acidimicrobiales bacterium]|nr:GerMN domain-containing protein [Acidimicrobiales bacterium]